MSFFALSCMPSSLWLVLVQTWWRTVDRNNGASPSMLNVTRTLVYIQTISQSLRQTSIRQGLPLRINPSSGL